MSIIAIQDWLNARGDHAAGVSLLRAHATLSRADEFFFSLPESPVLRDRLTSRLRAIIEEAVEQQSRQAAPKSRPMEEPLSPMQDAAFDRSVQAEPVIDFAPETAPASIRALVQRVRAAHKEMLLLKGLLLRTPDGPELTNIASRIVELDHYNAAGWKRIEFWRATGKEIVDAEAARATLDKADMVRRRQALRVWFSQRREGAKDRRSFTQEEWDTREAELKDIERKLHDADNPA